MHQTGQVFSLKTTGPAGSPLWAYRYRDGGRKGDRIQRGGFVTREAAEAALNKELQRLRRTLRRGEMPKLADFVDEYLAQHTGEVETKIKLRWLLDKVNLRFGGLRLDELDPREIAAWRMTIPLGHRFEATQALRQVLRRAVDWGLIETNAAKQGVDNPATPRREMTPFDSWEQLELLTTAIDRRFERLVLFCAGTGLRPGEWTALQNRDIDLDARVVHVRRALRNGRTKTPKTLTSTRTVPLQAIAARALSPLHGKPEDYLFTGPDGGRLNIHNFRARFWKPAQQTAGIDPVRRIYDMRHTFATFSLRAGLSTFDLSRYMGASLTMIDRHYGHLALDARAHALRLLDDYAVDVGGRSVDVGATGTGRHLYLEDRR